MKIYTKTGDDGTTGLFGGDRVQKSHPRIEACGTVDELNAALAVALSHPLEDESRATVLKVQSDLFAIGASLATQASAADKLAQRSGGVTDEDVRLLEIAIDHMEASLAPLKQFILPGGSAASAALHLARAVCRRAERRVLQLHHSEPVATGILIHLNRLSDLLFVMARFENRRVGIADVPWLPNK